jgi:hypothetical protein
MVPVEGGKGAQDRVLYRVGRLLRLPDQPPRIRFYVALNRLEQRQEAIRVGCCILTHIKSLYGQSHLRDVLLQLFFGCRFAHGLARSSGDQPFGQTPSNCIYPGFELIFRRLAVEQLPRPGFQAGRRLPWRLSALFAQTR